MPSDAVPTAWVTEGVVRPSRASYRRAVTANLWISIPLLLIVIVRVGFVVGLVPVVVGAVLLSFGGVLLYFRNARVEFGGGRYRKYSMFGRVHEFGVNEIGRLVRITAITSGTAASVSPSLLLVRQDGTRLLRLRGQTWDVTQFQQLGDDLIAHGVAVDDIPERIDSAELRQRYPRAVGWAEAHPIGFGLLVGLVSLIVIIAVVVVIALVVLQNYS